MNAATRAAVRYCLRQGHKPFAVHNGFPGLLDDSVHQLSWLGVDNWMTRGGSELGTNRKCPRDVDLGAVAAGGGHLQRDLRPGVTRPSAGRRPGRKGRAQVPSWDEILFGSSGRGPED